MYLIYKFILLYITEVVKQKTAGINLLFFLMLLAGGEGIEPSHALLESAVLPLYEPPTRNIKPIFYLKNLSAKIGANKLSTGT